MRGIEACQNTPCLHVDKRYASMPLSAMPAYRIAPCLHVDKRYASMPSDSWVPPRSTRRSLLIIRQGALPLGNKAPYRQRSALLLVRTAGKMPHCPHQRAAICHSRVCGDSQPPVSPPPVGAKDFSPLPHPAYSLQDGPDNGGLLPTQRLAEGGFIPLTAEEAADGGFQVGPHLAVRG
jgi:hypothetical protein